MKWTRFLFLSCAAWISFWLAMFQWWGFVILTPALLGYLFCKTETRRQCIIAAVAGGFIFWRLIQDSLSEFGQVGVNVLSFWQAITFIPVALSLRWGWRKGYRMFWLTPLGWVGGEYLRILGPIGFPFGSLALPAYEQVWLIQIADIGGIHLVSGVVAMLSGLLLDLAKLITMENPKDWSRFRGSVLLGGSILTVTLIYNQMRLKQIEQSLQSGPYIAVIQPDVPYSGENGNTYDEEELLKELKAMSQAAVEENPKIKLIVWPESMSQWSLHNPEYFEQPFARTLFPELEREGASISDEELEKRWNQRRKRLQETDNDFLDWVTQLGVPVLFGQITRIPMNKNGASVFEEFNAAQLVRPHLQANLERQFKIRLFPGGEYLPGGRERLRTWLGTSEYFSDWLASISEIQSGKERRMFFLDNDSTGDDLSSAFSVSICGEILFSESSGVFVHQEKNLFHVSIANEGRFLRNRAQLVTYMNLPYRAIESRRSIARSANTGVSGFADPTGRLHGQVRNSQGQYWTGKGYPEEEAIQAFQQKAKTMKPGEPDIKIQSELTDLVKQIRILRSEAGVSGYSIAKLDYSPIRTIYQKINDLFPQIALLGLITTTVCSFRKQRH
jgi:apolipoprotein N-acyltransferase